MHSLVAKIPNALTISRLLLIPVVLFLLPTAPVSALIVAGFAFFTDYLDGTLARRLGASSSLGALLDPIADKIIALALMGFFAYQGSLSASYFVLSATRDIAQLMAIPVLMGWKKIPFKVAPKTLPKVATTAKYLIIACLLLQAFEPLAPFCALGVVVLILPSSIMELFILLGYSQRFHQILKGTHDTFE